MNSRRIGRRSTKPNGKHSTNNGTQENVVRVPHDSVNEMVLIAAVIVDESARNQYLEQLSPDMFYGTGHALIWKTLQEIKAKGLYYDPATLRQLGGPDIDVAHVETLIEQRPALPPNLKHHVDMLHWDHARVSAAKGPVSSFLEMLKDPKTDAAELVLAAEQVTQQLSSYAGRKPSVLEERWVNLGDHPEWLTEPPPLQKWLLKRGARGVFPLGKTGLLNATGGVGKTYLLIQLALAVASGKQWLETFDVAAEGHVCLALAEEDADEAQRRIWRAANALGLTEAECEEIAERVQVLPLQGASVALTSAAEGGDIAPTLVAAELKRLLEARGVEWRLIILDPLSRWASGKVEADNECATRFCQVVETLTSVNGNPSVIVAHHASQASAREGKSDSRGVTGIRDGFRWQATLDSVKTDNGLHGALLRNRKSNYSLEFKDVVLVRSDEAGIEGTLRLATDDEAAELNGAVTSGKVSEGEYEQRVLDTVRRVPGLKTATKVAELTQGTKGKILDAVKALRREGRLELTEGGFVVVEDTEPEPAQRKLEL